MAEFQTIRQNKRFIALRVAVQISFLGHLAQIWIVNIDEHFVCCPPQIIVQLTFCLHHSLETAESQQMGLAHISHKTIVRKSNLYKFADVTRVARAHLDHGKLGL